MGKKNVVTIIGVVLEFLNLAYSFFKGVIGDNPKPPKDPDPVN